jgi:hypothetical protein
MNCVCSDCIMLHNNIIFRTIRVSLSWHHFEWWQAVQYSLVFVFAVSHSLGLLVQNTAVKLSFYSPYLKNVVEMFSFSSNILFTCSKRVVHCTLKFYKLNKPTRNDYYHLLGKMMFLYSIPASGILHCLKCDTKTVHPGALTTGAYRKEIFVHHKHIS